MSTAATLNHTLRDAVQALTWKHAALIKDLHEWAVTFNVEFQLNVTTPAICIDRLRRRRLGHFRLVTNGFGLQDEIAIDEEHATKSPRWRVLGTLLHEELHQWQLVAHDRDVAKRWRRNYHDREFRDKAAALGLIIDIKGRTHYPDGATPFRRLLAARGVDLTAPAVVKAPARPRTTLALWTCACEPPVKIRVGRSTVRLRCDDCGESFRREGRPCLI